MESASPTYLSDLGVTMMQEFHQLRGHDNDENRLATKVCLDAMKPRTTEYIQG